MPQLPTIRKKILRLYIQKYKEISTIVVKKLVLKESPLGRLKKSVMRDPLLENELLHKHHIETESVSLADAHQPASLDKSARPVKMQALRV